MDSIGWYSVEEGDKVWVARGKDNMTASFVVTDYRHPRFAHSENGVYDTQEWGIVGHLPAVQEATA